MSGGEPGGRQPHRPALIADSIEHFHLVLQQIAHVTQLKLRLVECLHGLDKTCKFFSFKCYPTIRRSFLGSFGLERAEEPIPHDQHAPVVLVDAVGVAAVVHAVRGGADEQTVKGTERVDDLDDSRL